jgi:hypothetical protein
MHASQQPSQITDYYFFDGHLASCAKHRTTVKPIVPFGNPCKRYRYAYISRATDPKEGEVEKTHSERLFFSASYLGKGGESRAGNVSI